MSNRVTRYTDSNYAPMKGVKMEVKRIAPEFGLEIFFLYHVINHLEIKFWVTNTLVASYSWDVIASKMCWKLTFGHRFDNNFGTVRNFLMWPECFRKYTFRAWIWTQILYFFDGNQESYYPFNLSQRVTRNTDSNYVPREGHRNGSLKLRSRIRLGNILPVSHDQSSQNKIFGKKYVSA